MLYLVILALAVVAVVVALPLLRRNTRLDEVDRFHVARTLTTAWSDAPAGQRRAPAAVEGDDQA